MPKKFLGENTKAVEARVRKSAQKEGESERKKQAEDDEYWKDDDKNATKKLQRKDDKQKKQQEVFERKQQLKSLLEKENENLSSSVTKNLGASQKVTRAEILAREDQRILEKQKQQEKVELAAKKISVTDDLLTENVNRLTIEGDEARTVEDAIKVLDSTCESADRHPEKRVKAAYLTYEEKNLARLKNENPNLRLSQLKQMLKKEWQKSPENPMNFPT